MLPYTNVVQHETGRADVRFIVCCCMKCFLLTGNISTEGPTCIFASFARVCNLHAARQSPAPLWRVPHVS